MTILDHPRTMKSERQNLTSFLLVLMFFGINYSFGIPSFSKEERQRYLSFTVEKEFDRILLFERDLNTSSNFITASGLSLLSRLVTGKGPGSIDTYAKEIEEHERWRKELITSLDCFWHFVRRSVEASQKQSTDVGLWAPYLQRIVFFSLSVIRHIHDLWNPSLWADLDLSPQLQKVTTLTPKEKCDAVGLGRDMYLF